MKISLYTLAISILIIMWSCILEPPNNCITDYSDCKGYKSNNREIENIQNDMTYVEYNYSHGILYLEHINAAFNCCPSDILADLSINGSRIEITEQEKYGYGACDCLCLYDVSLELPDLEPTTYTIMIHEPYIHEDDALLEFSINLSTQTSGEIALPRNNYPWGIY